MRYSVNINLDDCIKNNPLRISECSDGIGSVILVPQFPNVDYPFAVVNGQIVGDYLMLQSDYQRGCSLLVIGKMSAAEQEFHSRRHDDADIEVVSSLQIGQKRISVVAGKLIIE